MIKLDLFHAIQRTTKTLPKKHDLFQSCLQELRLVFCCKGDCKITRLSNTPNTSIIQENLDSFEGKWKHVTDMKGEKLFKQETLIVI